MKQAFNPSTVESIKAIPHGVPTIDLGRTSSADDRDRRAVARDVRAVSRETGMFYVTNHGVPAPLIATHKELAHAFFGLELAEKRMIDVARSNSFRGYVPFESAGSGDLKESFIMGPDFAPDHDHVLKKYPNTGTNLWPRRPAGFRPHMETYVHAIDRLGRRIAGVLALSLDLPADYFSDALIRPLTYSQMLRYPSLPAESFGDRLGTGAHVDWGMLTILLQDEVGGLEFRADDGNWYAAPPIANSFVVILGEMMLRLTNGLYRSALHRVTKNTSGTSRYSMPTFFDPPYDYRVACVPTCVPPDGEPRYPAKVVGEHMLEMARETLSAAATREAASS